MPVLFDVIIVGAGGSGLAAAVAAAERGLRVVVLEKNPKPGGTTGIAIGSFTGNRTSLQEKAGIADSLEDHQHDAGLFAPEDIEAKNAKELRDWFLSETAATWEWLANLGLSFHGPNPEPPNRVPRMHNVVPSARAYIAVLSSRLKGLGGTIETGANVESLCHEDGRVVGVTLAEQNGAMRDISAKLGVILATGDYANSPELIARWKGEEFAGIEGINTTATGDGHRLVESVGGRLVNMEITYGPELRFVPPKPNRLLTWLSQRSIVPRLAGGLTSLVPGFLERAVIKRRLVTWQHPEDSLFGDGAILVNQNGERFTNETQSPQREIALACQPNKVGYILLDQRLSERYSAWPNFISTAPKIAYAYVRDYLKLRPDVACAGTSLAEIADKRNVSRFALERTVSDFNRVVEHEDCSDPWGRGGDAHPLVGNRWILLGPAKAYFTTTEGGAGINRNLQVINADGEPIPGLYAVGQVGLGGQILWGHGLHIAWALTSGRIAGKTIGQRQKD